MSNAPSLFEIEPFRAEALEGEDQMAAQALSIIVGFADTDTQAVAVAPAALQTAARGDYIIRWLRAGWRF